MIETTYVRLAQAAEMLNTDADTLLVAAAEGRIQLWGLFHKWRRVAKQQSVEGADGESVLVTVAEGNRYFFMIPLSRYDSGGLLTTGKTSVVLTLSLPDEEGFAWEDQEFWDIDRKGGEDISFSVQGVFVMRKDVVAICDKNVTPEPGSIPEPPVPPDRSHISDWLVLLNQAARRWWANADRRDPATHPNNAAVAAWLIEKGMTKSLAERAASIIRPEWAHTGRKPDA